MLVYLDKTIYPSHWFNSNNNEIFYIKIAHCCIVLHTYYWIFAIHLENSDFEVLGNKPSTYGIIAWPKFLVLFYSMLFMLYFVSYLKNMWLSGIVK
jgi:hypothetical protein